MPNRLRYWDGRAWTTKVTDNASGGSAPGGGADGPGSKRWIWAAVAGAVVLALVVVLVVWNPFKPGNIAGPVPTYSPTGSAWNESETPTPTPTPTPSEPSPSITKLRCDQDGPVRKIGYNLSGERLAVGPLSMPAPSGWDGPASQPFVLYGEGAYGYTKVIEVHGRETWSNTMVLGPTNFAEEVSLETQARTIIACLASTDVLTHYKAPDKLDLKKVTITGHTAVQADAVYSWNHSNLDTKGSLVRVVVVDTSDGPYFFFGEATKERADMIAVMNKLSAGLAVS